MTEPTAQERQELARRKAKAEALLLEWTEKLTDVVETQTLIRAATYLRPVDYNEILLERNLVRLCGYPTCGEACRPKLGSGAVFRLSSNAVVDRDREPRFYSDQHAADSKDYAEQLSPEPLWFRMELDADVEVQDTTYSRSIKIVER